ncbi:uncharacterized protein EDB91DRAFT_1117434 [Suillus paluster]|uniref:uncharacterized protein n=1 Tax=Suillus paluster TaxID=48578 RepID=UPI001B86DAB5|nr:uncharacterized protein EDB91DRAFT_1117434 [Suillus paluster]KAG1746530.1 hypothetical protein EDB91DRAFT_1117434 [Suillus paluster]
MAFPIPDHLPRQLDVSSNVLSKIDSATLQSLNSSVASSCRAELDESIQLTKKRIHDRIRADSSSFQRQLSSAKSVKERLDTLSGHVQALSVALSDSKSGLVPVLLEALEAHQLLAQESCNTDVLSDSLSHLSECRAQLDALQKLIDTGDLPQAVVACHTLSSLLTVVPGPLKDASVVSEMQSRLRVLSNRVEELLSNAYTESVVVNASEVIIKPFVLVPRSLEPLPLSSVFLSISSASLASHLSTLRRDILTQHVEYSFDQPTSLTVSSTKDTSGALMHVLSRFPLSPNSIDTASPLANVSTTLDFLRIQLFPALPPTHKHSFPRSLSKPISTAVLARLLIPGLPTQLEALPAFLKLANKAVELEDKYIVGMLDASSECEIKAWVNNVCTHYERQRRSCILDSARKLIIQSASSSESAFHAQLPLSQEISDQAGLAPTDEGDAWGFDDDGQSLKSGSFKSATEPEEEDVWGFDDDLREETETRQADPTQVEEDPGDAWGWNDEEPAPEEAVQPEDNTWDDPWGDESFATPAVRPTTMSSQRPSANSAPTTQKVSTKSKQASVADGRPTNGTIDASSRAIAPSRHPLKSGPLTEPYLVSTLAKSIIHKVEDALYEGKGLASSGIFPPSPTSTTTPGTLVMQSGALVLDLYRAVYPIVAAGRLARPGDVMKFSNDCFWLAEEVGRLVTSERGLLFVKDKLDECKGVLRVLADSWYQDGINRQRTALCDILASAKGFTDTSDQDRYDDCEMAISRVVREIRSVANTWKPVLPKSKYYTAVGAIVEVSLQRILENILAIPDIPEVESHKLSELCRILAALEGLFVEDFSESSFVVSYVPSWLKFSYLSELMEASMADLTYLFEEGALVDFEVDELVKLVRALFADTPLRTKTLDKIMGGHPVR